MSENSTNKIGKVLIIEDNPTNIQVAASILHQAGYEHEFAMSGDKGIEWLKKKPFDVILLDIMMPEKDGYQVCKEIKAINFFKTIPIIFLTAKTDRESIVKGFEVGGSDYITKPFDKREFLMRVQNQVELKQNRELLELHNKNLEQIITDKTYELANANEKLTKSNLSLQRTNSELKYLEESKQHFLNMLGKNISLSFNEIVGTLQVVKYNVDSKKTATLIDRIDNSLAKIELTIESAITISKTQSKNTTIDFERVEINKLLGLSIIKIEDIVRRKNIKINNITNHETIYINGNQRLIVTAFIEILSFFISRNKNESQITIETKKENESISIKFTDNTPILTDEKTELFDVFSINNRSLYMSRLIAQSHHGDIIIENDKTNTNLLFTLFTEK